VAAGWRDENTILRIDHVAVAVHDLEASLGYYIEELGLPLIHREEQASLGVQVAFLDGGSTLLQLVQPTRPGPVQEFLSEQGEGLHHICLAVGDIGATLDRLARDHENVTVGAWQRRACFLQDRPNGLRIELTEVKHAESLAGSLAKGRRKTSSP
jgi:methylmalonyl-CoA epimerase